MLAGFPLAALAQAQPAPAAASPTPPPATPVAPAAQRTIKSLRVEGSQRIEPETVLSYTKLRVGGVYTSETLDQAIKDLYASDLFADVAINDPDAQGNIVVRIRENPIINRVVLEGNKTLKSDKITKELKLKPRDIFTRSAVRQDVGRIIELYRRQGRFAATVDPKMVALDQNRVDIIFEISEGPKSKVRQINIIGNHVFNDDKLREQMATKQARFFRLLSSATSYDQDRLAYDQQKLRQFYLTEGYADFRVTSAVAELTPDKRDFIITYVVEEGKRYKFGDVTVDSDIRDFDDKKLAASLPFKKGDWYNAKQVEDSVDNLNKTAGLFGYAFADTNPEFSPDHDALTMGINFHIAEAQRTYVESIDINGNTNTHDKVVRREMRLAEGDAFNSFQLTRSQDRINSLGYFQDKLEIKQAQGSAPDRVILQTDVQEKPTGSLNLSAGYSSLERFIIQASITQANFRGMGQTASISVDYSAYSKSIELGFQEPFLFDKNVALGVNVFRRDLNQFNYNQNERNTIYNQLSTGFQVSAGVPLTEYLSLAGRYTLQYDQVDLDKSQFYTDGRCDPLKAGSYLCDAIGNRLKSAVGYSLIYSTLNNSIRPTKGVSLTFSQDLAGLGGDVRYVRTYGEGHKYWDVGHGFILSTSAEGGWIAPLESDSRPGVDAIRITDRFYLGEPQFRGFDIRGLGPRIRREYFDTGLPSQVLRTGKNQFTDDSLGGRAYYLGHLELEIPLGAGARDLGLRPSIFMDAGALFGLKRPAPTATFPELIDPITKKKYIGSLFTPATDNSGNPLYTFQTVNQDGTPGAILSTTCATGTPTATGCVGLIPNPRQINETTPFVEHFYGNTPSPRLSVGVGVNWKSPFGPLRIDIAKALLHQKGEDTKLVTFNVGTQF